MLTVIPLLFSVLGVLLPLPTAQQSQAIPRAQVTSPHGNLNMPCENCHTLTSWRPLRGMPEFDHDRTKYPLRGMHVNVSCMRCHKSLVFSNAPTTCARCHADLHRGQFGANCEQCHTVKGWNVSKQKIQQHANRFPLIGAHATVDCDSCHKSAAVGQFAGLSVNCYSCHQVQYQNAVPNHQALGFPPTCESCHTSLDTWLGAKFDHAKITGFALTGMHATIDCVSCHIDGNFKGIPATCYGCHAKDFNGATNPNHTKGGFPHDCAICHTTSAWTPSTFDHAKTPFPLTGLHTSVACSSCHINGKFAGTPTDCASCHITDYNNTNNPPHKTAGIPTTCAACHTTSGWNPAKFDHSKSVFPLTGLHVNVPCTSCHIDGKFTGTPTDCASCHIIDYNNTTNPNHKAAGKPTICVMCHTTAGWSPVIFSHSKTSFPLTGLHVNVPCTSCHINGNNFALAPTECASCHITDYNNTNNPPHKTAGIPTTCVVCHTTSGWNPAKFDHSKTVFPLTGQHVSVACTSCHINGQFTGTPTDCASCHITDYNNTTNPNHKAAGIPTTCAMCHSTSGWKPSTFDHSKTPFPLTGLHVSVPCTSCHINGKFAGTPTDCASCHITDYNNTNNPNHKTTGIPTTCAACHSTSGWTPAKFDHSKTVFPLTGQHVSVACTSCHINGKFVGTPTDCASCHINDFNKTTNPNHKTAGIPTTCAMCHSTSGWSPSNFDHSKTPFPLTGLHVSVPCTSCHINGKFVGTPTDCASCHITDYNNTNNPNHKAAGIPTTCAVCHSTSGWKPSNFDHSKTPFPLTGLHVSVPCTSCHINGKFVGTPTDCASCHITDYNNTNNPNHKATGIPTACVACHSTSGWIPAKFDHSKTPFPLTGLHVSVPCTSCHINGKFAGTPTDCASCHITDYNNTNNPNHKATGIPTTCAVCHTTTGWSPANFDHSKTGFPLTGAHTTLACATCHVNNNFNLTQTACIACHFYDYNGTTNPPHKQLGFPTDCTGCHSTANWTSATFNHTTTGFPLTGAHTTLACASCHVKGNFSLTQTACIACHQNDYNGTTNPPHKQLGFPTDCTGCHSTASWAGAMFNHSTTGFPLTGAHAAVACASCHVNGNFSLTQTACIACHQNDYNGTTNPPHKQLGFPTDCTGCHSTANWTSATFNHSTTGFPLTGAHTTLACASCHVNGNFSLTQTACIACHQNDYNGTTNPPHKQLGFPTDCTGCHSTASWAGAMFNHSTTGFPLTGAHAAVACASCHVNGNFSLTQTACIACHQNDYNGTTNPPHQASGFPTDCTICHSTANWTSATFNHTTTGFPLTGAHTTLQCVQCHVGGNYHITVTTCISCHQNDYNGTTNPPHQAAGFPTDCTICHSTANWTSATFNHTSTGFPLTGFHTTLQCVQCHVGGNYHITVTTCISCHQNDYNGTTNPPHQSAGFPTDCTICHSTANWTSATFNHTSTGFPLTGFHLTMQCAQCHVNNNYSLNSPLCSNCHMGDYNGTNNPNHAAAGFPTTCDTCHTTTSWAGATFNHNNTPFPLTGAHVNVACTSCHINNVFAGTPTDCYSCHKADYTGTNNPNHAAAGFPTTCATCHTTTAWTGAVFNHTWFPTNHGNANGVCSTCHTNSNDYSVFTCTVCHGGNNAANFHHPNVNGYVYNSVNCYACHKNGGGG